MGATPGMVNVYRMPYTIQFAKMYACNFKHRQVNHIVSDFINWKTLKKVAKFENASSGLPTMILACMSRHVHVRVMSEYRLRVSLSNEIDNSIRSLNIPWISIIYQSVFLH